MGRRTKRTGVQLQIFADRLETSAFRLFFLFSDDRRDSREGWREGWTERETDPTEDSTMSSVEGESAPIPIGPEE